MEVQTRPIRWVAQYLMCDCGADMQFVFSVRTPHGVAYLHKCPNCERAEEVEKQFPSPVWEEA